MDSIKIRSGFIRHSWPEKAGLKIDRPNGIDEYLFLHFWTPVQIELYGQVITTQPNACIIIHRNTPQLYYWKEPLTHDWFRMIGDVPSFLEKYGLKTNTIYYPKNFSFITSLTRKLELEYTVESLYSDELCECYLKNLFIQLARELSPNQNQFKVLNTQTKNTLKKLRYQLSLEYDKKWTISSMAEFVNFSPSYLHATYKNYYGVSPIQDLITIRMQQATILLSDNKISVNEIAEKLGYPNTQQFIRQFTKSIGISPLKYRKSASKINI